MKKFQPLAVMRKHSDPNIQPEPASIRRWLKTRIPLYLLFAAVFSILFPTNGAFLAAAFIGSVAAIWAAYLQVFRLKHFRLSWILADGLLLGYALGGFNTAARLFLAGTSAAEYFHRPQSELSAALGVTFLVSAVLFFFGALVDPPIRLDTYKLETSNFPLLLFGLVIVGAAFVTGNIGYMGVAATSGHHVSVLGALAGTIAPVLAASTVLFQSKCRSRVSFLLYWVILAVALVSLALQGRRILLYGVLLLVVAFKMRGDVKRLPSWKVGLMLAALLTLLYAGNIFFYAMRVSTFTVGRTKMALPDLGERALDLLHSGRDTRFDQMVANNLRDRTFVLRYFSDLLAASWTHEPLYGEDVIFCLESALPSVLYPDKDRVNDIGMEENLANPQFGLYPTDEANSILTTGVSDFGAVGAALYPVVLVVLMGAFLRTLNRRLPEGAKAITTLAVLNTMWQTEISAGTYFVLCRNLLLLSVPLLLLSKSWRTKVTMPRRIAGPIIEPPQPEFRASAMPPLGSTLGVELAK